MSQDGEKSSNSNHIHEFPHCDQEFDSVLDVIRRSNIDPYKICLKRIIGEKTNDNSGFDPTMEFKKRLADMCNKEVNKDFVNFDFDILSKCGKEIINDDYGSINYDKAGLLVQSSTQVYSGKVDHLHSLVSQAAKNIPKRSQHDQPQNVSEQTAEDNDFWVPDGIEVDPNCTLEKHGGDSGSSWPSKSSDGGNLVPQNTEAQIAFDKSDYGKRVLHKLSQSANHNNTVPFADVVVGEEKRDVARSFSAILDLANNGTIDLQRSETNDGELMPVNPFSVRFLKHIKRRQEVQFQPSKKRAVSQKNEGESKNEGGSFGKENREPKLPSLKL